MSHFDLAAAAGPGAPAVPCLCATIDASRGEQSVTIEYRDDGRGMTREQRHRLYDPFYTTKRNRGGTGLGMHIAWSNVKHALGGTISCASAPGKGVLFTLVAPQQVEAAHVQDDARDFAP